MAKNETWELSLQSVAVVRPRSVLVQRCQSAKTRCLAHQVYSVEMWPWRMDFSRADCALIVSSGMDCSIRRLSLLKNRTPPLGYAAAQAPSASQRPSLGVFAFRGG